MAGARPLVCVVPSAEVLDLAAELAGLGGGDVAVGRAWVAATAPIDSAADRARLDACFEEPASLISSLQQELWPWLHRGFNATVVLLSRAPSGGSKGAGLSASGVVAAIGSSALERGMHLGITWQLVGSTSIACPLGVQQQQQQPEKQQQGLSAQQPGSRVGRSRANKSQAAAEAPPGHLPGCVVRATTQPELDSLLRTASAQLDAAVAAVPEGQQHPPHPHAHLVHLTLLAPNGQPASALHVLQLDGVAKGEEAEPAVAVSQQEDLLKLLQEVADLHRRRREGEHLLAAAKLSPLNQLVAPLVVGGTRLFLVADLCQYGSIVADHSSRGKLLDMLPAARHIQAVCPKGAAGAAGCSAVVGASVPPAAWLCCQQFQQHLEQRRQAEQQRRAEAAALAAAEADRREKLKLAAKQRQQQLLRKQEEALGAAAAATARGPAARAPQQPSIPQAKQQPAGQQQHLPLPQGQQQEQQQPQPPQQEHSEQQQPLQPPPQHHRGDTRRAAPYSPAVYAPLSAMKGAGAELEAAVPSTQDNPGSNSSLQRLRQEFQTIYQQTVGDSSRALPASHEVPASASGPAAATEQLAGDNRGGCRQTVEAEGQAAHPSSSRSPGQYRHNRQLQSATMAVGVAAADDVATHVATLRMKAAAEALQLQHQAQHAQHELLADTTCCPDPSGTAAAAGAGAGAAPGNDSFDAEVAGFDWEAPTGGAVSLGQQLEQELALLQQHQQAATPTPHNAAVKFGAGYLQGEWSAEGGGLRSADMASLADLDAPAPSLGAVFRLPVSKHIHSCSSSTKQQAAEDPGHHHQQQQQQKQQRMAGWQSPAAGTPAVGGQACSLAYSPAALSPLSWSAANSSMLPHEAPASGLASDVFNSENLRAWSPQPAAMPATAAAAGNPVAAGSDVAGAGGGRLLGSTAASNWGASQPLESRPTGGLKEPWASTSSCNSSICSGSYAAARREQVAAPGAAAAVTAAAAAGMRPPVEPINNGMGGVDSPGLPVAPFAADASVPCMPAAAVHAAAGVADLAGLLAELEREQRVNATLLQQLHELQQQLEEALTAAAAAAAAAAVEPLGPGAEDPANFNGLLAALQLERQQHSALRQQMQLQQQQADEQRLALEAQLHTQHRQLLVAAARCRAWEQQSPLPAMFQRYEEEVQRQQAQCQRLEEESLMLAQLLAEADLERLAGAAQHLPEEAAAVCREHKRKLLQAQAQIGKLQQERGALQKRLQGAERRDRLAELCRKQAESGMKASAELRQQLAARERQLETQSLAAAAAAAEASRLRDRLEHSEVQLGRALAEKADLQDAVESLRKQVALLRGQAGCDRVLRHMQLMASP